MVMEYEWTTNTKGKQYYELSTNVFKILMTFIQSLNLLILKSKISQIISSNIL